MYLIQCPLQLSTPRLSFTSRKRLPSMKVNVLSPDFHYIRVGELNQNPNTESRNVVVTTRSLAQKKRPEGHSPPGL